MFKGKNGGKRLFTLVSPKSPIAESFRILRTNITFSLKDRPQRLILFTSVNYESGKSMVTANLGVALAQADNRVLIIDCDLRNPKMNRFFPMDSRPGLVDYLRENSTLNDVIRTTNVQGLSSLPSGPIPPNPSELLCAQRMKDFLESISGQYDVVLLDAPPVIAFADAAILAPLADGVVLVVKAGCTSVDILKNARDQLEKANARILGVVLNEVKIGRKDLKYYYFKGQMKTMAERDDVTYHPQEAKNLIRIDYLHCHYTGQL